MTAAWKVLTPALPIYAVAAVRVMDEGEREVVETGGA
jgi:hypothetical protein